MAARVFQIRALHGKTGVFADRADAGARLAAIVEPCDLVLAIPAGGVPVGVPLAARLRARLDVAIVSKITLPWNTEVGFGAVAFDGTVRLDEQRLPLFALTQTEIDEGIERTRKKVGQRVARLCRSDPAGNLRGRSVILVDDGLASGFTMEVAVDAVRRAGARRVAVAVPTGHEDAVARVAAVADAVYCANVRGGPRFAVAEAYREWHDVSDEELDRLLRPARSPLGHTPRVV